MSLLRVTSSALALAAAISSPAPAHGGGSWIVVHTWPWTSVADTAAALLTNGSSALDAAVSAAGVAERDETVESVGRGAHPDAAGEPTLDALVMDGDDANIGAVGALRGVASAAAAARLVLDHTSHSLLVGSQATTFASAFGGLPLESLSSAASDADYARWQARGCQPSYWTRTSPPPSSGCGPFRPLEQHLDALAGAHVPQPPLPLTPDMHDTLSVAVIDAHGSVAAVTTTNGLAFKIPGRVGDAAIPGSGNYARSGVGACGSTGARWLRHLVLSNALALTTAALRRAGDGDVMMRFLPCYQVVESMRLGWSPLDAAEDAIARIRAVQPSFTGAVFALAADGRHAGAAHNWVFQYTVRREGDAAATVFTVSPRPAHAGPRVTTMRCTTSAQFLAAAAAGGVLTTAMTRIHAAVGRLARAVAAEGKAQAADGVVNSW